MGAQVSEEKIKLNVLDSTKYRIGCESVLASIAREVDSLRELAVVTKDSNGDLVVYCTGDLTFLPAAALKLESMAHSYIRGEIILE